MERLEKIAEKVEEKKPVNKKKETYQGLNLLSEVVYHGGTSIRYWM
mgnify:CR=1 FL=1